MKVPMVRVILFTIALLTFSLFIFTIPYQNEVPLPGWEKNVSRNASHYLLSNNFNLLPENICDLQSLLLMIVISSPKNVEARSAIRKTWGRERNILGKNVLMYFLVGESTETNINKWVELESYSFGDIIRGQFHDSYHNLTLKSINMLKVVTDYCALSTKFVLKIDDDMLLNINKLVEILLDMEEEKNILMGKLMCGARPVKNPSKKWYTPKYMYEGSIFPNYISGTSYLMSTDVAIKLFQLALSTPMLHLEDVYLTGICAQKAGITPRNNVYFTHHYLDPNVCEYTQLITMHHFTPESIMNSYNILNDSGLKMACKEHRPVFNAHQWVLHNILKPNRDYRKYMCM